MSSEFGKEGAEYLVEVGKKLAAIHTIELDNRRYTRQDLKPVEEPLTTAIRISTLSSLADLCTSKFRRVTEPPEASGVVFTSTGDAGFEGFDPVQHVVHVVSPTQVQVVTARSNVWKRREILIDCNLTETTPFKLGVFLNQDEFIIAVLSCFVQSKDRDYVAKLAGNAMAERVTTAQDDGVSQSMGTRAGATLAEKTTVKNIVNLQLYRTFREVEQPTSQFLFRLKQAEQNIPQFAFFEADGGAWKLTATENIARYLRTKLPDTASVVS
jgi:hypothetical protein